jgi:hypothetical protein
MTLQPEPTSAEGRRREASAARDYARTAIPAQVRALTEAFAAGAA